MGRILPHPKALTVYMAAYIEHIYSMLRLPWSFLKIHIERWIRLRIIDSHGGQAFRGRGILPAW